MLIAFVAAADSHCFGQLLFSLYLCLCGHRSKGGCLKYCISRSNFASQGVSSKWPTEKEDVWLRPVDFIVRPSTTLRNAKATPLILL